jgi:hypothetical protein
MAKRVSDELSTIDPPLPTFHFETRSLGRCVQRLRLDSPVGAQGQSPESLAARVRDHRDKSFESDESRRQAFKALCDEFAEEPLDVPKILLSGYYRRSEIITELYDEERPLDNMEEPFSLQDQF